MTQSIREKAIEAMALEISGPTMVAFDGSHPKTASFDQQRPEDQAILRDIATAAFDAAIKVLMEPDEQFLTGPFEEMLETQGHAQTLAESWRMLLKGGSQ